MDARHLRQITVWLQKSKIVGSSPERCREGGGKRSLDLRAHSFHHVGYTSNQFKLNSTAALAPSPKKMRAKCREAEIVQAVWPCACWRL
jgi:hypothetical protein